MENFNTDNGTKLIFICNIWGQEQDEMRLLSMHMERKAPTDNAF